MCVEDQQAFSMWTHSSPSAFLLQRPHTRIRSRSGPRGSRARLLDGLVAVALERPPPRHEQHRDEHDQPRADHALKTKAAKAEAEAKKLINELKARRKVLKEKLSELKHASGGAWEDVKTGATRAWDELRPALRSAISKFK